MKLVVDHFVFTICLQFIHLADDIRATFESFGYFCYLCVINTCNLNQGNYFTIIYIFQVYTICLTRKFHLNTLYKFQFFISKAQGLFSFHKR